MTEKFLSTSQASQILGVNNDTMRRYLRKGKIRGLRLGKDWKIPEKALNELANSPSVAPSQHTSGIDNFLTEANALTKHLKNVGFGSGADMVNKGRDDRAMRFTGKSAK